MPRKKELDFSGVFMVRDGALTVVTDELEGPNGIAFSPDERCRTFAKNLPMTRPMRPWGS